MIYLRMCEGVEDIELTDVMDFVDGVRDAASPASSRTVETDQDNELLKQQIDFIYKLYPTKCPNRNTSTGKCTKDKEKIKRLIRDKGYDNVVVATNNYVKECIRQRSYLKNFSTFLNNFPDIEQTPTEESHDEYFK